MPPPSKLPPPSIMAVVRTYELVAPGFFGHWALMLAARACKAGRGSAFLKGFAHPGKW